MTLLAEFLFQVSSTIFLALCIGHRYNGSFFFWLIVKVLATADFLDDDGEYAILVTKEMENVKLSLACWASGLIRVYDPDCYKTHTYTERKQRFIAIVRYRLVSVIQLLLFFTFYFWLFLDGGGGAGGGSVWITLE